MRGPDVVSGAAQTMCWNSMDWARIREEFASVFDATHGYPMRASQINLSEMISNDLQMSKVTTSTRLELSPKFHVRSVRILTI